MKLNYGGGIWKCWPKVWGDISFLLLIWIKYNAGVIFFLEKIQDGPPPLWLGLRHFPLNLFFYNNKNEISFAPYTLKVGEMTKHLNPGTNSFCRAVDPDMDPCFFLGSGSGSVLPRIFYSFGWSVEVEEGIWLQGGVYLFKKLGEQNK